MLELQRVGKMFTVWRLRSDIAVVLSTFHEKLYIILTCELLERYHEMLIVWWFDWAKSLVQTVGGKWQ